MQVVVRIIIILVIIFLIWLLRRWIRRLIFILILLVLAFFIYGIFNPSGAARLWYNVRTFPQRMASWMGSGEQFLDYNTYKSKISSIGNEIGDKIDDLNIENKNEDIELGEKDDVVLDVDDKVELEINETSKTVVEDKVSTQKGQTIKAFPKSVKFVKFPELNEKNKSDEIGQLTGYSKADLLGVVNEFIERNLDDYTDILVTVEYDDSEDPQRVILEAKPKSSGSGHGVYFLGPIDELLEKSEGEMIEKSVDADALNDSNNEVQAIQTVKRTNLNGLTQKDQQEAEEIFSILF